MGSAIFQAHRNGQTNGTESCQELQLHSGNVHGVSADYPTDYDLFDDAHDGAALRHRSNIGGQSIQGHLILRHLDEHFVAII